MTPNRVNVPAELIFPHVDLFFDQAQKILDRKLKSVKLTGLQPPQVLVRPSYTNKGDVEDLDRYAIKLGADLIVAGTHTRTGAARFFLGSFAETLLLYSRTPIVVIGPKSKAPGAIRHILFPTDLGTDSVQEFDRLLGFAKEYGAKVTIAHFVQQPLVVLPGSRALVAEQKFTQLQLLAAEKRAAALVVQARKYGVAAKVWVSECEGSMSEEITDLARKLGVQLIAMVPQSGRLKATLIGSMARQVVRAADRPVWLLHESKAKAKPSRRSKAA